MLHYLDPTLTTLSQLLSLAQNLNQLFKEADTTTQNKILRFALPANSTIYAKVLWCKLDNTLALLALLSKKEQNGFDSNNWCRTVCNKLTDRAVELEHDVLFNELADTLRLDGSLLAA